MASRGGSGEIFATSAAPALRARCGRVATINTITVTVRGRRFSGDWRLVDGKVEVGSAYGSAAAAPGRRKPERVAAELLERLAIAWCDR